MQAYILPAFLGVGLVASCGLRTFLPLFILPLAARFHFFGIDLNPALGWIGGRRGRKPRPSTSSG